MPPSNMLPSSNSKSPLSPNAQLFFALLSNSTTLARLTGRPSNAPGVKHINSSQGIYRVHDRIFQLPIANEDQLFSYYEDMKARLAKDSTSLGEPALELAKNTQTLAEAVIEVQLGCYVEITSTLLPDCIRARSLAEDAAATGQVLTSLQSEGDDVLDSVQWREREKLVNECMTKVRPFLEKNSFQRESIKKFLKNPAELFSPLTIK